MLILSSPLRVAIQRRLLLPLGMSSQSEHLPLFR